MLGRSRRLGRRPSSARLVGDRCDGRAGGHARTHRAEMRTTARARWRWTSVGVCESGRIPGGRGLPLRALPAPAAPPAAPTPTLPHHVAMIIDGNRRWARAARARDGRARPPRRRREDARVPRAGATSSASGSSRSTCSRPTTSRARDARSSTQLFEIIADLADDLSRVARLAHPARRHDRGAARRSSSTRSRPPRRAPRTNTRPARQPRRRLRRPPRDRGCDAQHRARPRRAAAAPSTSSPRSSRPS